MRTRKKRHAVKRLAAAPAGWACLLLAACGSSSSGSVSSDDDGSAGARPDATAAAAEGGRAGDDDDEGGSNVPAPADAGAPEEAATPAASDAAADAQAEAGTVMSVYVTFYGWADNSPPGGAIAYPKSDGYPTVHETAGGTGTYADPITFASDKAEFPVGTILYVPFIEKYVIMEDDCVECDSDWTSSHKWHIDLWMNSDASETASSLASCEDRWTRDSTAVESDPPSDRTVTTTPLFTPATNTCRTTP